MRVALKRRVAFVHAAKERAARRVIGPDLLLVAEGSGALPGYDNRRHPGILVAGCGRGDIVCSRDGDRFRPLEGIFAADR